jgi:antitoxin component YwqK of YwqJK toxin-antitoxin module
MVRPTTWVSSLTIGLALACKGLPVLAQGVSPEDKPAPAHLARAEEAIDTVTNTELVDSEVIQAHSVNTNAANDESSSDSFGVGRNRTASDTASPAEIPVSELVKERFPNGSVKVERRVTQDAQGNYLNHGSWKMWDQRGSPVAQGTYDFANRTGTWTRWYRNAVEADLLKQMPYSQFSEPFISQATFKHDQLDGLWTIYDGKMRKISQLRFADGKRQGTATWWYLSGRKMREMEYKDGELDGQLLEWSPEGKLLVKDTYQAGRKVAAKLAKHPDGGKKSEGMYLFAKEVEQTPDDWWNCKLAVMTKNGGEEKHGVWTSWYSNGQTQLEGAYEHDVQVGKFVWWHSNGQKAQEGRFDHGKQDGSWTWWYPTGQKSIRGEYVKGNPTGKWTWWKEDGRVVQAADLSHSEGIVVELPTGPDGQPMPRSASPTLGQPIKR